MDRRRPKLTALDGGLSKPERPEPDAGPSHAELRMHELEMQVEMLHGELGATEMDRDDALTDIQALLDMLHRENFRPAFNPDRRLLDEIRRRY